MVMSKIVEKLRKEGHEITYVKRKDGGIRVTSIDNIRFDRKRSAGNIAARAMAGETLSARKEYQTQRQLKGISQRVGRKRKTKKAPLPDRIKKELRKAQSAIRKATRGSASKGTVSAKTVRKIIEEEGASAALRKLQRATRYFQGYAYPENVLALAAYVEKLAQDINAKKPGAGAPLKRIARAIRKKKNEFMEAWIKSCHEVLYDLATELRTTPASEWGSRIQGAAQALATIIGA